MPRVSVLMAVHNGEKYLPESLESIRYQTYRDYEFVVVDDGSTDTTARLLADYAQRDRRFQIHQQPNQGLAASLNRGLAAATGEYVARMDSDDVSLAERLQTQVDYLDAHPKVIVLGSAFHVINEHGRRLMTQAVPADALSIRWRLLFGNCIGHSTVMYRKAAVQKAGGYDVQFNGCEDFDLWVRLLDRGDIAQLESPLVNWRRHPASVTGGAPGGARALMVKTVANSIQLQTYQPVELGVAEALLRDSPASAPSQAVWQAYRVIQICLDYFVRYRIVEASQRDHLATLALDDVFRLARYQPRSYFQAWRLALSWAPHHVFYLPFTQRLAWRAVTSVFPTKFVTFLAWKAAQRASDRRADPVNTR